MVVGSAVYQQFLVPRAGLWWEPMVRVVCRSNNLDLFRIGLQDSFLYFLVFHRYTAADMQIVCILIFPVLLLLRQPTEGIRVVLGLIGGSMMYSAGLTYYHDASPIILTTIREFTSVSKILLWSTQIRVQPAIGDQTFIFSIRRIDRHDFFYSRSNSCIGSTIRVLCT